MIGVSIQESRATNALIDDTVARTISHAKPLRDFFELFSKAVRN